MENTINLYQTLNEREKYILEKLEVKEEQLKPEYLDSVLKTMFQMTERISQLPITKEQFVSAFNNFDKSHEIFFKGINFIASEDDYPKIKFNVYRTLSKDDLKIIKMLGVKLKDTEITSKEYADYSQILINFFLVKFGTGIKEKECYKLIRKVARSLM